MFSDPTSPRLFALPPGADFPQLLVDGILDRLRDRPPEALARVELFVNTRRMQRRIRALLAERDARLLPRLRLITDLGRTYPLDGVPPPVPPLRRRLQIAQLVERLLEREPDLAPRAALFDLADSLARLADEMQGEGVPPEALEALDVSRHAQHWERTLKFVRLVAGFVAGDAPDIEGRQRLAVEELCARWRSAPPTHPVLVAGSTGSRGTTAQFMAAVARLPQGALVLPGFDFEMPDTVWEALRSARDAEDHPQFRFSALLAQLSATPAELRLWRDTAAPAPARNRLVSLALRPAPVTDQWMHEGPRLDDIEGACAAMTLIEAPSPRSEALAIALRLRQAAETGQRAAVITPDRILARQITAALDRWRLVPDDSAGRPLALSAPGRLLRHVAALMAEAPGADALVTLLKHPLTHSGGDRGAHLRHTRDLELYLRRRGIVYPDAATLRAWGAAGEAQATAGGGVAPDRRTWAKWIAQRLDDTAADATPLPLAALVARHRALAEAWAGGPDGTEGGALWQREAGEAARRVMDELAREAVHGGTFSAADFLPFVTAILHGTEVREPVTAHPGIMIWGTLEARVQGADLVILAGLNEGVWPQPPAPDPWLNRPMRSAVGLLLPERSIGLAAHDFQQAVAAPEVVLSRAIRDSEAQTVPARWLNRLVNLLDGLPATGGRQALTAMRARGRQWLTLATALEADFSHIPAAARRPACRPAPAPPVAARPRELPVTAISRLIRDPYAVYARYVLGLRPLDPLRPRPDAALRGTVLHRVFEAYARSGQGSDPAATLIRLADEVLARDVPWAAARALWRARLARVADWFAATEAALAGVPVLVEEPGRMTIGTPAFTLTARPDRIDAWPDGRLHILDYKTGAPPSRKAQEHFDKQLLLEALIVEAGGFGVLGPREVAQTSYVGLGPDPKLVTTPMTPALRAATGSGLQRLLAAWQQPHQGYVARRALFRETDLSDYDHLSRFGEWQLQDAAPHCVVGGSA